MNEWSRKRRRNVLLIALTVAVIIVALSLYYFSRVVPTCFDNKMNGDETGVDCGGSCTLLCGTQSLPLVMHGDPRVLKVATSTYEVVASIENPNATGVVLKAAYTFTLYEASSTVPVKTITGTTYVPKGATFAIFEGPFDTGDKTPTHATLTWDESSFVWQKDTSLTPDVTVTNTSVQNASSSPRIEASVSTTSLVPLTNVYLVALVYDNTGTIAAASKTYLDTLSAGTSEPAVFSWPEPFAFAPVSVQIIPVVLPDSSYIR